MLGETERKGYEKRLAEWQAEGFEVSRLAGMLKSSPQEASGAFETAERGILRNRELGRELETLQLQEAGDQLTRMHNLLRDPWMSGEAETLLVELQVHSERKKKEEQRKKREAERRLARLRERAEHWKAQGYLTAGFEGMMDRDLDAAEAELPRLEDAVSRLGVSAEELGSLDTRGHEAEHQRIQEMLRDPARAQDAEEAILHLRLKIEKTRRTDQLRSEQEKRERARLRDKVSSWRDAGLNVHLADDFLDNAAVDILARRIEELEETISRCRELLEELGRLPGEGLEKDREAIRALLHDPEQIRAAEEKLIRLKFVAQRAAKEREKKAEESRRWRKDLHSRIQEWKGAGYDTSRLDDAFERDDEALKKEWVMFRIQLKRVQELESELRALPSEGIGQEVGALVAKLRAVSLGSINDVETGIRSLKSRIEARREEELRAREAEKKEKQELVALVMRWVEEGYRDGMEGKLEQVVSKGIPAMREDVRELGARITRAEAIRKDLMAADITGFESEAAAVLEELFDLTRIKEMEVRVGELKDRMNAKREEERRRAKEEQRMRDELRSKITGWKRMGFNVSALEANLDGDIEFLRKEYSMTRLRIQKAQVQLAELNSIPAESLQAELSSARDALLSLDRMEEGSVMVERLRMAHTERVRQGKKLEELRKKMEDWREQGYDVSRLEKLLGKDIEAVTKEFLMFKIRIQKLRELEEELRSLDTGGFEDERSQIEKDLRNIDRLGEVRDRLSELELKIGRRMAEEVRLQDDRRKVQGEYMARMSAWLEEGFYVDSLEGALGKAPDEMAEDFRRFEEAVSSIRQKRERLEELSGSGYEELIARIREKLRDVGRLEEVTHDIHELWERIERRRKEVEGRRKEEDELRLNIVKQIENWETMGYDVSSLEKIAGGKMEELRRGMINFRMKIERMQGLQGILDAMDTRGFENEVASIRSRMRELDAAEAVESMIEALRNEVRARHSSERAAKEKLRRMRDDCTDRFLALLAQGYNVDSLEGALELPYEELSVECERIEGVAGRLKEIEQELKGREQAAGAESFLARVKDIHALGELEEYLANGKVPGELKAPAEKIQIIRYGHGPPPKEPAVMKRQAETRKAEVAVPAQAAGAVSQAPSLAAAIAVTERQPATAERQPGGPAAPAPPVRPAAAPPAGPEPAGTVRPEPVGCGSCGEPVEPGWKRCPACLKPLVPAGPAEEPPEKPPGAVPVERTVPAVPAKSLRPAAEPAPPPRALAPAADRKETPMPPEERVISPARTAAPPAAPAPPALASAAQAPAPPPAEKAVQIDRIPARPERDLGIRDEAAPERREGARRETPIDPEKLVQLRKMIDKWKTDGDDVGDLEEYLASGVVTREGMRLRLEAINARRKGAEPAPWRQAEEAPAMPAAPDELAPEQGATAGKAERTDRPTPENGGLIPDEGGEPSPTNGAPPGDGVRKLKKVKKVAK